MALEGHRARQFEGVSEGSCPSAAIVLPVGLHVDELVRFKVALELFFQIVVDPEPTMHFQTYLIFEDPLQLGSRQLLLLLVLVGGVFHLYVSWRNLNFFLTTVELSGVGAW